MCSGKSPGHGGVNPGNAVSMRFSDDHAVPGGHDGLVGGAGNDVLEGTSGSNTLEGGAGNESSGKEAYGANEIGLWIFS